MIEASVGGIPDSIYDFEVGGGVLLNENYEPVDPFIIESPVQGYILIGSSDHGAQSTSVFVTSFDEFGTMVSTEVEIPVNPVGIGEQKIGPVALYPDRYDETIHGGLNKASGELDGPRVDAGLGLGSLSLLNAPEATGGDHLARVGLGLRPKLEIRFLNRDGTDFTPGLDPGSSQQTEIGDEFDDYAEKVNLMIRAVNQYDPTQVSRTNAEVGLTEISNGLYVAPRFFDGELGNTKLDDSGRIGGEGGSFLTLNDGVATLQLILVAERRKDKVTETPVVPEGLMFGIPYYGGPGGALLRAFPVSSDDFVEPASSEILEVGVWGDERTYERTRQEPDKGWTTEDEPNGIRDWIEKHAWDVYSTFEHSADPTRAAELEEAANAVESLGEFAEDSGRAGFVAPQEPTRVNLNAIHFLLRRDFLINEGVNVYYKALFYRTNGTEIFENVALHELRHVWQNTLPDRSVNDADSDRVYDPQNIPDSSLDIADSANISAPGGVSGDGHFRGDSGNDSSDVRNGDWEPILAVRDRNAMRFVCGLDVCDEFECALESVEGTSDQEVVGAPGEPLADNITVKVLQKNSSNSSGGAPGVTVRFSVINECDATVDGNSTAWVLTDGQGNASVAAVNGTVDCVVRAEVIPLMSPPAGTCSPTDGSTVDFSLRVELEEGP